MITPKEVYQNKIDKVEQIVDAYLAEGQEYVIFHDVEEKIFDEHLIKKYEDGGWDVIKEIKAPDDKTEGIMYTFIEAKND